MTDLLKNNEEYIDGVALSVMQVLLQRQIPKNHVDALRLSREAYRQALAMLEIKLGLETLATRSGLLNKYDDRIKIRLHSRKAELDPLDD